jgi:hypothetical protein
MPVELINLPLNSGVREDLDSKLLPEGMFKTLLNCRLRKGGEIGVRHGYRALGSACFGGGVLKAFDLVSHNETLLAFGSERSAAGGPEKVFTWNENTSQWKGEETGTRARAFSAISELEQVFRPPFVKVDEDQLYDIAYANNHVALVYEEHATSGGVVVHIFDPDNGSVLFSTTVASRTHPRVVGVGSVFVFAWQDGSDDVRAATFTVGSSTALSAETVLHNTGTVGDGIDLAPVAGASEFVLLVVRSDTNVCTIRRCTTALSVSATGTLTRTDISLASVASATGTTGTVVAYVDTSGNYEVESFNTSTLASAVGPTALFGGSTGTRVPAVVLKSATEFVVAAAIPDTIDQQLKVDVRALSNHAASAARTFREVSLQSKPFVSPDGLFVGALSPYAGETLLAFTGIFDLEHGRGYECAHHRGFALDALPSWLGSVATDGTRFWAVFPVTDLNCQHTPVVMQFRCMSPERRQTASLGGLLFVAGGFVGCWDGVRLVEAGYFDTPVIDSATPSNGAGALTPASLYIYAVAYEWYDAQGNRHLSPVSDDVSVTTGVSDDTVTLVVSAPHSLRVSQSADTGGKVIVYRTKVAPDRVKRRAVFEFSAASFAQSVTLVDLSSDDDISTQEVIYTQGARGTLSGPLQHEAPFPAQYLCAGSSRIGTAGLPDQSQWQESKRAFPGEPIEWSGTPGHFGNITGRTTARFSQDDISYVASRSEIFVVGGVGPDDNGNGEFDAPRAIPGDSVGVIDWRSVLRTASGTWFQAYPDRLYLLPRGGGAAEWLSQAVRDTLAAYPVIVGAAVSGVDDTAVWACNDAGGTTRRLVCTDLRTGDWYVDDLSELPSGPIQSICEHLGRIHLVIGGLVYRQDTTFPASAFIPMTIVTGSIAPSGTEGYCKLKGFLSTGKFRARHKIEGDVSFDDGVTFGTAGQCVSAAVTINSGYTAGDTVSRAWRPKRRKGDRFVLRLRTTEDSGASEGETLSNLTLEVIRKRKSRRSSAKGT